MTIDIAAHKSVRKIQAQLLLLLSASLHIKLSPLRPLPTRSVPTHWLPGTTRSPSKFCADACCLPPKAPFADETMSLLTPRPAAYMCSIPGRFSALVPGSAGQGIIVQRLLQLVHHDIAEWVYCLEPVLLIYITCVRSISSQAWAATTPRTLPLGA